MIMKNVQHRTFVLVQGAWHGAWVWRDVMPGLRALGHTVTASTLTGPGERRHVGNDTADLGTHVEDVVSLIEMEDLRAVTLVGWSCGGMVTTGALARIPERISRLVYFDAFVPADGRAVLDYVPPDARTAWDVYKDKDLPLPPLPLPVFAVTDPAIPAFVEPACGRLLPAMGAIRPVVTKKILNTETDRGSRRAAEKGSEISFV
jgi:pimeloyl-ACP methyl ester carboxylesterase